MPSRLLVVEDAFVTRGRGVLLNPKVTADPAARAPFNVRLRFPNGDERATLAVYEFSHVRGPLLPFALVRLLELTPEEVPPGTEVWSDA